MQNISGISENYIFILYKIHEQLKNNIILNNQYNLDKNYIEKIEDFTRPYFDGNELSWLEQNCKKLGMPEMTFRTIAKTLLIKKPWNILSYYTSSSWYDCYKEYLQTTNWTAIRKTTLLRDNDKCVICNKKAQQVHHLTYDNVGFEKQEDLISVCKPCHEEIHFVLYLKK